MQLFVTFGHVSFRGSSAPVTYHGIPPSEGPRASLPCPLGSSSHSNGLNVDPSNLDLHFHDWLASCANHKTYKRRRRHVPQGLPTRLIDLTPDGPAFKFGQGCKLVKCNEIPMNLVQQWKNSHGLTACSYLALSYVWGVGEKSGITIISNLKQREKRIFMLDLPKTIRNAIAIARNLGVRYLWVDSICIVQATTRQSKDGDWNLESRHMLRYYSNALCTIAAAAADNMFGGCLMERESRRFPVESVRIPILSFLNEGGPWLHISPPTLQPVVLSDYEKSSLLKRAWALQELVISPRILFLGREITMMICGEVSKMEGYGNEYGHMIENRDRFFDREKKHFHRKHKSPVPIL